MKGTLCIRPQPREHAEKGGELNLGSKEMTLIMFKCLTVWRREFARSIAGDKGRSHVPATRHYHTSSPRKVAQWWAQDHYK
jgi:hypothetical protein